MHLTLRDGSKIPAIGFGTGTSYFNRPDDVARDVQTAFERDYRHFDTAQVYGTEDGLGEGVKRILDSGKAKRDDLFITTKIRSSLWNYSKILDSVSQSLDNLKMDYVDLLLIHDAGPRIDLIKKNQQKSGLTDKEIEDLPSSAEELEEARLVAWEALQHVKALGLAKHIGVSNFTARHLEQIIKSPRCKVLPEVNQIECNPYMKDTSILDFCTQHGVLVQAYAPLGNGGPSQRNNKILLADPVLLKIAAAHSCTAAQVALKWALNKGINVITKTEKPLRMTENIQAVNVQLTAKDMKEIDDIQEENRIFWNPYDHK